MKINEAELMEIFGTDKHKIMHGDALVALKTLPENFAPRPEHGRSRREIREKSLYIVHHMPNGPRSHSISHHVRKKRDCGKQWATLCPLGAIGHLDEFAKI